MLWKPAATGVARDISGYWEETVMSVANTVDPADPAREFVDFWNEILAPKFIRFKHVLVDGLTHHSAAIFPSLPVSEGDNVLDVGCGFGDTAIQLAGRTGADGRVAAAGLQNVTFIEGDVQSYPFEPEYDFVFSRFGTMFFENPVWGLKNMRAATKPGGLMTMIVWRTADDNPWLAMAKQIVLNYLPPSGEDARTCGPGPFSMAGQETVTGMLKSAGYVDPQFKRVDAPVLVGRTVQDSIDFQLALGPAGEVFREAGDLAELRREEIEAALSEAISPHLTDEGIVMESSSWVVTARNPA
jgi:ubiquinone/menaquinone biosynthesis C-methylase UbiE